MINVVKSRIANGKVPPDFCEMIRTVFPQHSLFVHGSLLTSLVFTFWTGIEEVDGRHRGPLELILDSNKARGRRQAAGARHTGVDRVRRVSSEEPHFTPAVGSPGPPA
mmetsp:Transcript_4926/g.14919  ORF Transcript_4926/g.14919 Transcript_4926/m.14919 type:complete len:108 (+) Transcript_4926:380-703(+)